MAFSSAESSRIHRTNNDGSDIWTGSHHQQLCLHSTAYDRWADDGWCDKSKLYQTFCQQILIIISKNPISWYWFVWNFIKVEPSIFLHSKPPVFHFSTHVHLVLGHILQIKTLNRDPWGRRIYKREWVHEIFWSHILQVGMKCFCVC